MTEPPGPYGPPIPPPPGPPPPRRFATFGVVGGVIAYLAILVALLIVTGFLTSLVSDSGAAVPAVLGVSALLPVLLGIYLAVRGGTAFRRGFGLGLAIGWAVWGIVGAGACLGILALINGSGP